MATRKGRFTNVVIICNEYKEHICSGVLIHESYILTAAHCIDKVGPNPVVVVGAHDATDWRCQRGMKVRLYALHTVRLVCGMMLNPMGISQKDSCLDAKICAQIAQCVLCTRHVVCGSFHVAIMVPAFHLEPGSHQSCTLK